jgi:hypothetical protein
LVDYERNEALFFEPFILVQDYAPVDSTDIFIHPLDLGSSRNSISGPRPWHKTYNKEYVWGQLIGWYKQSVADPGASLGKAARGCLTLPDVASCYAKSIQHDFRQGYGSKHREKMIGQMVSGYVPSMRALCTACPLYELGLVKGMIGCKLHCPFTFQD